MINLLKLDFTYTYRLASRKSLAFSEKKLEFYEIRLMPCYQLVAKIGLIK